MNDLTPEQRARALELYRLYFLTLTGVESDITDAADVSPSSVKAWEAVEAHVLASHTCPDVESDARVQAWRTIAEHRFFTDCYSAGGTLVDAMVAKLDAAHDHTCVPVWRPVTREEIQPGWGARVTVPVCVVPMWGVAHHRDDDGDWLTEMNAVLTHASAGWTYETTAPLPEPKPDPRVETLAQELHDESCEVAWPCGVKSTADYYRKRAVDLLARLYALAEGDQS